MMTRDCELRCEEPIRKIVRIIHGLQRSGYHGSLTIDFNMGVPQVQRLRKIEMVDAMRR